MDIQHCAERICEHRFGAAKIGEYSQKLKDVLEEILAINNKKKGEITY
jgi:hypothetical protein